VNLGQLIEKIRGLTVDALRAAAAEHADGGSVIYEPALRGADGKPVTDGALALPTRVDLVVVAADGTAQESVTVDSKRMVTFEPVSLEWDGGMDVQVEPFQWDWCGLRLEGLPDSPKWTALTAWFLRRFESEGDGSDLSGVVHFLGDPSAHGDAVALTLDFGSAPADAFGELLQALSETGARRVLVGRPSTTATD